MKRATRVLALLGAGLLAAAAAQDGNLLADAASPYLRQHAANPVHWRPWGDAAFAQAAAEDKPVFLSIGYATCHWCHVMAKESFSDPAIAAFLNEHYVCIKVDREERPDVDQLYQAFVQATGGGGGWPLTVWLDPHRVPLAGATYFPPDQLLANLQRFSTAWNSRRAELTGQATAVADALVAFAKPAAPGDEPAPPDAALFTAAADALATAYDQADGGFGSAPKFPQPAALDLLLRLQRRMPERRAQLDAMGRTTWTAMADGGIHDQLGGGFHRYSLDAAWRVPHFEKMLYDQAQLLDSYLDAWLATGDQRYREVARGIVGYVLGRLVREDGAFAAAEDADSVRAPAPGDAGGDHPEHAEGAYYVWSEEDIRSALAGLGDQAEGAATLLQRLYGVEPEGNVAPELDPRGELRGRSVLALAYGHRSASALDEPQRRLLDRALHLLAAARSLRPRPALDDQAVAAWNGLMIGALARAGTVLGDHAALAAAARAAGALRTSHWRTEQGLARTASGTPEARRCSPGTASDYACLIHGLIALEQAGAGLRWLAWAVELQEVLDRHCWDERRGGYVTADDRTPGLVARLADDRDGAEPSADAMALGNLARLADLTGDDALRMRAGRLLAGARRRLAVGVEGHDALLAAVDEADQGSAHLTIVGDPGADDTRALLAVAWAATRPRLRVLVQEDGEAAAALRRRFPAMEPLARHAGRATAYLCLATTCLPPIVEPDALATLLAGRSDAPGDGR